MTYFTQTQDVLAKGFHDDGTESGHIRIKATSSDLAAIPFRSGEYVIENDGATASAQASLVHNRDGSGIGIQCSVTATAAGAGVRIWFFFSGKTLGIRWRTGSTAPDFVVSVGGNAVLVQGSLKTAIAEGIGLGGEVRTITHTDLPTEGPHLAEVYIPNPTSGTVTVALYGYLAERRLGYVEPKRINVVPIQSVLTTGAVAWSVGSGDAATTYFRSAHYYNSSASAVQVTVNYLGTPVWSRNIAAGDTQVFDPGSETFASANWTHLASVGSVVNATIFGGAV